MVQLPLNYSSSTRRTLAAGCPRVSGFEMKWCIILNNQNDLTAVAPLRTGPGHIGEQKIYLADPL